MEITVLLCSQILGFIAKGSFGPILKVKDVFKEKTYAVKVSSAVKNKFRKYSFIYEHTIVLCNSFHCGLGLTKVRDLEASSAGAVKRGSHRSGISQCNVLSG